MYRPSGDQVAAGSIVHLEPISTLPAPVARIEQSHPDRLGTVDAHDEIRSV